MTCPSHAFLLRSRLIKLVLHMTPQFQKVLPLPIIHRRELSRQICLSRFHARKKEHLLPRSPACQLLRNQLRNISIGAVHLSLVVPEYWLAGQATSLVPSQWLLVRLDQNIPPSTKRLRLSPADPSSMFVRTAVRLPLVHPHLLLLQQVHLQLDGSPPSWVAA